MIFQNITQIKRHIKSHSVHSALDNAAVSVLESFLRSNGRINTDFNTNDKWPNTDGVFEFVENPDLSRKPQQNFFVQIKGTHTENEKDGLFKYSLQDLAFPAYIAHDVTLNPGIIFVVFDADLRGQERVFWKYVSVDFLNSIDFSKDSTTISFSNDEELLNTDASIYEFCKKLSSIVYQHSFVNKLSNQMYNQHEIERIISACNRDISESIARFEIVDETSDSISQRIIPRLWDLCMSTLLMNSIKLGSNSPNLQLAWEQSLLSINTRYLSTFLKGLRYISNRIPEDGQSERLMLKYYNFLWQIRKYLKDEFDLTILDNLEEFHVPTDKTDQSYYETVALAMTTANMSQCELRSSIFYVQKKTPFFVGKERYFEITFQLAGIYTTKYNRITAYTKEDIPDDYSIQIGYTECGITLWEKNVEIKVVTNWKVAIDPSSLNKFGKIMNVSSRISSKYNEYRSLMSFLTKTGMNLIDFIDLNDEIFTGLLNSIYKDINKPIFKDILLLLHNDYSINSQYILGRNVLRYLLLNMHEETILSVLPKGESLCDSLQLSKGCLPFEKNPLISDLKGAKTANGHNYHRILSAVGYSGVKTVRPYLSLKSLIQKTGEIYFQKEEVASDIAIDEYNNHLDGWEKGQGYGINIEEGLATIESYEKATMFILNKLLELSKVGNKGQKQFNERFLRNNNFGEIDDLKLQAISNVFVNSRLLLIYGAAGTGKTTLINHISNLMSNHKKLFLTKTHTAKQNLKRRIDNPGIDSEFVSIDSFNKKVDLKDYDVIFVDECSTIDNRTMATFLSRIKPNTFLVFAGDIHQIESIEFGNWFLYAKDIIVSYGANVELLSTWRTDVENLKKLWDQVRNKGDLMEEILSMDGPFSKNISEDIFSRKDDDEVVLCLNYDGKFGLNNMNYYFQNVNTEGKAVHWQDWTYKKGDKVLFCDTGRFNILYNNLKGKIVDIEKYEDRILFTIDVETNLTESDCNKEDIDFIEVTDKGTRIRFTVYSYSSELQEDELRMKSTVPFQLAYAVSIHKAQGLEYESVKVIIPQNNAEKVTHGIFYTAITRARKCLNIYCCSTSMKQIIDGFSDGSTKEKSLNIIKSKFGI